jgi:hypothetical protein
MAFLFAFGVGQDVFDISDRESMFLDVFDIAT